MLKKIYLKIKSSLKRRIDPLVVQNAMKCIHGPSKLNITNQQFVVVCMVKNGEFFMRDFLNHYFELGAHHIVFIDNGSTDKTTEIAKSFQRVTILQCMLPAKNYETLMRKYVAESFCKPSGWCLFADMDEFFDFPGRESKSMPELLNYLNSRGYSAVVSQMVDMYPSGTLEDSEKTSDVANFLTEHCYYDIEHITYVGYHDSANPHWYFLKNNTISDQRIQYACGGVRKRVFNTNSWLSKHPLVRLLPEVTASVHPACSSGVVCANFMAVLKHYKFAGDFANRVKNEVAAKTWDHGETETYHAIVATESPVLYKERISKKYTNAKNVIDNNFLFAAPEYLSWIEGKS